MKQLIVSFLICCILIFSCKKSPTDDKNEIECRPIAEDVLEPHAEGNFWEREQHAFSGGQIESGLTDTGSIVIEKMLPIEIGGKIYTVGVGRVIYPGNIPNLVADLSWNNTYGLYSLGMVAPKDTMITEPRLQYKYPVSVGEKWKTFSLSYDPDDKMISVKDTFRITCVAKDEPFITPIDTFSTIVYHYYYKPVDDVLAYWHTFQYFSPSIGPVGTEVYSSFDTTYAYENRKLRELKRRLQVIDYCLH